MSIRHKTVIVSRRQFLRVLGLGTLGAAVAACEVLPDDQRPIAPQNAPINQSEEASQALVDSSRVDQFIALSAALTGFEELNADLAQIYLRNIQNSDALSRSLNDVFSNLSMPANEVTLQTLESQGVFQDEALNELAKSIMTYWYTGSVPDGEGSRVVTYVDNLAWQALDFTKPRSICGSFGFWESDPRIARQ